MAIAKVYFSDGETLTPTAYVDIVGEDGSELGSDAVASEVHHMLTNPNGGDWSSNGTADSSKKISLEDVLKGEQEEPYRTIQAGDVISVGPNVFLVNDAGVTQHPAGIEAISSIKVKGAKFVQQQIPDHIFDTAGKSKSIPLGR